MYSWTWRRLPGPLAVRVLLAALLLAAAVAVLFVVVFPRVEARLPYSDVNVNGGPGVAATPTSRSSPAPSP